MNMLKRTLALMLVLCMMLSAMPFTAFATESTDVPSTPAETPVDAPESEEPEVEDEIVEDPVVDEPADEEEVVEAPQSRAVSSGEFQRILHLDCGRKYFTADWIKALITEMSAAGYTHLQLAFGNDGMRFLLDNMSVTVNGTTYGSDAVKAGIQAGNKAYYDAGDKNELTQAEMDSIIKHANAKGIQIVPHMNMPGHMDAILDAIEYVGISDAHFTGDKTSARSLNLNNATAVAFTKALLKKYVAYFEGKCSYFHIGADEFANDAYGNSMGFPSMGSILYNKFASFVNDCAAIVEDAGMTPRAWNDGIDYGNGTVYNYLTNYSEDFDTDIQITYWSPGWGGYYVAPASTLSDNGHDLINTHGGYYYILGVDDCFTSGTSTSHKGYNYTAAESFSNTTFNNNVVISNPIGSMFCIWCDVPGAETETEVAMYVRPILRVMGARMQDSNSYDADSIVAGGFNADGTINGTSTEAPTPETVTKTESGVSVTAAGLTGLTVTDAAAPTVEGATAVKAWNMTPVTEKGNYTGSATVSVPVSSEWTTVRGGVLESANGEAVSGITGTLENGVFTFTVPHFSTVYAYNLDSRDITNTVNVRIPVNGTSQTYTVEGGNYEESATIDDPTVAEMHVTGKAGVAETVVSTTKTTSASELTDGATFIIRYSGSSYALTSNKGGTTWADSDGDTRAFENYSGAEADNMWTLEASGSGYKLKSAAGYLNLGKNAAWITQSGGDTFTLTYSNGGWAIGDGTYNIDALGGLTTYYCAGGWPNSGTRFDLYKVTTSTPASTEVSFTGLKIGTTFADVGSTRYNIEVVDPNNMYTKEENVELLVDEVKIITDKTGNYEASYTGAGGLDEAIATVQVKGTTTEGGKKPVPVTSIENYSKYYIQLADGKYLTSTAGSSENVNDAALWSVSTYYNANQVYIYSGDNYLYYNNGSFTPTSSNWTIYGFNAGEISVGGVKLGTIVTLEDAAPEAATEITITGVSEGETKVIVGETRYNITVIGKTDITIKYQTEDGTLIKEETVQIAKNATTYAVSNFTHTNGKFYAVNDPDVTNGTLSITPATVTEYTVTVEESTEDLSKVTPLALEYWITNQQLTDPATALNYLTVSAETTGVHSESGVAFTTLAPDSLFVDNRTREYWQVRMLDVLEENNSSSGTEHQTLGNGDDETTNGDAVTHVRYWGGKWQVKSGSTWLPVDTSTVSAKYMSSGNNPTITYQNRTRNQLIAYYMEVIDIQNANGTTELHINAADWGKKGDGSPASDYLPYSSYCSVSIQLVYEDNNTNPSTTTAEALKSKSIVYGYNSGGRGIGTFIFDGLDQYQIYKVTAETGEITDISFSDGDWGTVTVNGFDWDSNEKTVWQKTPTQKVSIHNNTKYPDNTDPKDNLMWDENHEAILIRVYVKALATEDTLNVHYLDRTANNLQFYDYSIPVAENTVFNSGFAMGTETNTLVNNSVVNYYGSTQSVSADLATMPQIAAYYRYCNYTLVDAVRSDDGKDVYLYYTFTPVVTFAADFGLPIQITPTDLNQEGYSTNSADIKAVKVIGTYDNEAAATANAIYGSLSVSGTTVTYTPTTVMKGIDFFTIYVITQLDDASTNVTNEEAGIAYRVYVVPTTTVYYEESFLDYTGTWSKPAAPSILQTTEILGSHKHHYGYDPIYAGTVTNDADDTRGSNNTKASTSTNGATASFTFTGTGFELYANCNDGTGYVTVTSEGQTKKMYMIDTGLNYAEDKVQMPGTTATPSGNFYNIPIISEKNLPHGTYTVTIRKSHADNQAFEIDGFRVINTINESAITDNTKSIYYADKEDKPVFYQLRDFVLNSIGITNADAKQVYTDVAGAKAIVTTAGVDYDDTAAQDLLNHGPKNELYLFAGQTLTFSVKTDRLMQIGLKAPNGATTYDLKCTGVTNKTNVTMGTSVDMFYELGNATGTETTFTVTVKNTGNNILAVTDLKICDDPNAAFVALSEDDIAVALGQKIEEDVTPEVPTEPEVPETTKPSKPGKPNKPSKPTKPTEPEVEETKPSKPGNNGNNKPGKPNKDEEKTYTLKITFVNLFGKKVGTATITTTNGVVSAYEIAGKAPAGYHAIWLIPVTLRTNGNTSVVIPVI